jgi:(p)ppGpp synthase/HD superfamily hydrolase
MHHPKNELEATAFRILCRQQHETVSALLHQTRDSQNFHLARRELSFTNSTSSEDIGESMQQILTQVQTEMTDILKNNPELGLNVEAFKMTARVKESYSTWKKMLRDHME